LKITLFILLSIVCSIGIIPIGDAFAASHTGVDLGEADSFALLATTITNTNPTIVSGDVGSGPAGQTFTPSTIIGNNYFNDDTYTQANTHLISAIDNGRSRTCDDVNPAAVDMGGSNVQPGVYCIGGAVDISGGTILTLDGDGLYIFDITGALNTVAGTSVVLTNGATSDNVFWVMTGATTLGAGSNFAGTILSDAAITIGSGTTVDGRVLTTGPLTIATSTVTVPVVDTTAPIITLVGADLQIIEVGGIYNELGATASDNLDGDITASIVTDSTAVNTATPGSYFVTYDVTDANGNSATQVSRVVDIVVDCSHIGPNAILIGCDLTGANLSGANLTNADLSYANLWGANLFYANLSGANLTNANLSGTNISYANLSGANLINADLSYANLWGANLSVANLINANISYANLWGANLFYANLSGTNLSGTNLSGVNFYGAITTGCIGCP
jgi:uncharacterized protein YjbI with pentapeptide repeats